MGFIPFEDVIKLEAIYLWSLQTVQNVHYYKVDSTPNLDTAISLCAGYIADWTSSLRAQVSSQASLVLLRATIMENENDPGIEYSVGLPLAGTNAAQSMPNNVTVAVKWGTGYRGRSYRGRTYHIGLTESHCDGSMLTTAARAAIAAGWNDMIAVGTNVGPAVMVVASRFHNKAQRLTGVSTPVLGATVDSVVDSQRRRLPGRGR